MLASVLICTAASAPDGASASPTRCWNLRSQSGLQLGYVPASHAGRRGTALVEVRRSVASEAAVVGRQAGAAGREPHLDEAQWRRLVVVVLAVRHPAACGHELHRASAERLSGAHAVFVRQAALHDVGSDLRVAVRVRAEACGRARARAPALSPGGDGLGSRSADGGEVESGQCTSVRLHQVVVHDPQNTEVAPCPVVVLCE